jgi:hypothetical protein
MPHLSQKVVIDTMRNTEQNITEQSGSTKHTSHHDAKASPNSSVPNGWNQVPQGCTELPNLQPYQTLMPPTCVCALDFWHVEKAGRAANQGTTWEG